MGRRLLLTAFLVGALAAAADARIVVQHGIAGVSIGMSQTKVRSVLGRPRTVTHGRNTYGRFVEYRYPGLVLDFQGPGPLSSISTTRHGERTATGVGVGSTRAQVQRKVRGAQCGKNVCVLGTPIPGRILTAFYLRRGIVTGVLIGRVLD